MRREITDSASPRRRVQDSRVPSPETWREALERVADDPSQPRPVFQPIVDLAGGSVVGYEALARFAGPPVASPQEWFESAAQLGQAEALEARVIRAALSRLDELPRNSFLSVNVTPDMLGADEVSSAFESRPRLDRLMVELTEHTQVVDSSALIDRLDLLGARGARIAVDDAGTGYSGLSRLLAVRPSMVKLDRALVADVDRDPAKRALIEMIGVFAGRLDAWILAEGVERVGELEELIRLRVPLAQGFLLGRPESGWMTELPPALLGVIGRLVSAAERAESLAPLIERAPVAPEDGVEQALQLFLDDPGLETVVLLDVHRGSSDLDDRGAHAGSQFGRDLVDPVGASGVRGDLGQDLVGAVAGETGLAAGHDIAAAE